MVVAERQHWMLRNHIPGSSRLTSPCRKARKRTAPPCRTPARRIGCAARPQFARGQCNARANGPNFARRPEAVTVPDPFRDRVIPIIPVERIIPQVRTFPGTAHRSADEKQSPFVPRRGVHSRRELRRGEKGAFPALLPGRSLTRCFQALERFEGRLPEQNIGVVRGNRANQLIELVALFLGEFACQTGDAGQ